MLKATTGQAIGTGIISGLKIACGITVIVLIKVTFDVFYDLRGLRGISAPSITYYWIFGLPFIIPGILGLFAAGFRNAVTYGIYMAFCIISCIVDGVFCIIAFAWLFAFATVRGVACHTVAGECFCITGIASGTIFDRNTPSPISVNGCSVIDKLIHVSHGAAALMIIGWILCLVGAILSCAACCCGRRDDSRDVWRTNHPVQMTVASHTHQNPAYAASPKQVAVCGYVNEKNQNCHDRMY